MALALAAVPTKLRSLPRTPRAAELVPHDAPRRCESERSFAGMAEVAHDLAEVPGMAGQLLHNGRDPEHDRDDNRPDRTASQCPPTLVRLRRHAAPRTRALLRYRPRRAQAARSRRASARERNPPRRARARRRSHARPPTMPATSTRGTATRRPTDSKDRSALSSRGRAATTSIAIPSTTTERETAAPARDEQRRDEGDDIQRSDAEEHARLGRAPS